MIETDSPASSVDDEAYDLEPSQPRVAAWIDERAEQLRVRAAAVVEQEAEEALDALDYGRWRETIGALKREGIVDQARALLRDRMDRAGDDSLDGLLLQLLNPEEHSSHLRHRRTQRCKAVRLDARAKVAGKPIGRERLARETGVPETTIQSWRNRPDYQRTAPTTSGMLIVLERFTGLMRSGSVGSRECAGAGTVVMPAASRALPQFQVSRVSPVST